MIEYGLKVFEHHAIAGFNGDIQQAAQAAERLNRQQLNQLSPGTLEDVWFNYSDMGLVRLTYFHEFHPGCFNTDLDETHDPLPEREAVFRMVPVAPSWLAGKLPQMLTARSLPGLKHVDMGSYQEHRAFISMVADTVIASSTTSAQRLLRGWPAGFRARVLVNDDDTLVIDRDQSAEHACVSRLD